ncbi:MAG TPA: DUF4386 domain-containing protein [Puia sp.]|nr:DUF4386 domain-containing protein [Puia sp.]
MQENILEITKTARLAGILFAMRMAFTGFGLQYVRNKLVDFSDAAGTVNNIIANATMFRAGIISTIFSQMAFLFLGLTLYRLFKVTDRKLALLLLSAVIVIVAMTVVNTLSNWTVLLILNNEELVKMFAASEQHGLTMLFLRLNNYGQAVVELFWGFWLFPFGMLIVKSGFIPKLFGILLIMGAFALPLNSLTFLLLPQYQFAVITRVAMIIAAIGGIPTMLWLIIRGAGIRKTEL